MPAVRKSAILEIAAIISCSTIYCSNRQFPHFNFAKLDHCVLALRERALCCKARWPEVYVFAGST